MSKIEYYSSPKNTDNETDSMKSLDPQFKISHDPKGEFQSSPSSFKSLNTVNIGFSASKKCYICSKNFKFRKRYYCKFCMNSVCSDHSAKVRIKEGFIQPQRICDFCDQEEKKTQIKSEIDEEVSKLGEELRQAKNTNEKLYKDHFEKITLVNQLEESIAQSEKMFYKKTEEFEEEMKAKLSIKEAALEKLRELKEKIQESVCSQQKYTEETEAKIEKMEEFKKESLKIKANTEKKTAEVERLEDYLKNCVDTSLFADNLCSRCNGKVLDSLSKAKTTVLTESSKCQEKETNLFNKAHMGLNN